MHGFASSPVIHGGLVIVLADGSAGSALVGLDRRTGDAAWRTERPATGRHGNYSTPVVARFDGGDQLLAMGMGTTCAYDPRTGALLWTCTGPAEVTACTPAFGGGLVFASGGYPGRELLAIRPDGRGDVTATHVAWRTGRGVTYVPTPLFHDGRLYMVNDDGVATCLRAADGAQVWQGRLEGNFSSSPVLSGDRILVSSEEGTTSVLGTGDAFEVLARNDLGEGCYATPAVCGGRVYLRTEAALYCIAGAGR
jgi:outer membrane protein assembly factor BamB